MSRIAKLPPEEWDPRSGMASIRCPPTDLERAVPLFCPFAAEKALRLMGNLAARSSAARSPAGTAGRTWSRLRIAFPHQWRSCMAIRYSDAFQGRV